MARVADAAKWDSAADTRLAPAFDTGVSSSDDLTKLDNAAPSSVMQFLVGNTLSGSTVRIYADGELVGSAVATSLDARADKWKP